MFLGCSLLAVIPARSGSKGLPSKNILDCAGRPLIAWTVEAAKKSQYIDEVLVSTDSERIAHISIEYGASVPSLRPGYLALDHSSLLEVIQYSWETFRQQDGRHHDYLVVLQPTSPLRSHSHIDEAINSFFQRRGKNSTTLASVYEVSQKSGWLMHLEPKAP